MEKSILTMSKAEVKKEVFKMELKGYLKPKALHIVENALNNAKSPKIELNLENVYIIK